MTSVYRAFKMSKVSNIPSALFLHTLHSPHCQGTSDDRDVMMNKIFKALGVTDFHMAKIEFQKRLFYCPYNYHQHNNPLMSALSAKHYNCTKLLLNLGMSPNGYIFIILMNGTNLVPPLQILLDMHSRDYSLIKLLLRSGAHPDTTLNKGIISLNCLSFACLAGDLVLMKLLLRYGASIILFTRSIFGTHDAIQHEVCFDSPSFCAIKGNAIGLLMLFLQGGALGCEDRFVEMIEMRGSCKCLILEKPSPLLHDIFKERSSPIPVQYKAKEDYEKCLEILREGGVSFWEKTFDGKMLEDMNWYEDVVNTRPQLIKYVKDCMSKPLSLKSLARIRIKKMLNGRDYQQKIEMLELPSSLVDFLAFDDLVPRTLTRI